MELQTERLLLRPWRESDAEDLYTYASDPRVGPICGWRPHPDIAYSRKIIKDVLAVPETYAVVWRETGRAIGSVSLRFDSDMAQSENECELGFWLGAPFWGRGIMPEAARELLRHAFEDLGAGKVWCGYFGGNDRSRRVQEKLGFRFVKTRENMPVPQLGETRTGYDNVLTKADWAATRLPS